MHPPTLPTRAIPQLITSDIRHLDSGGVNRPDKCMDVERAYLRRVLLKYHESNGRKLARRNPSLPPKSRDRVISEMLEISVIMALLPIINDELWAFFKTTQSPVFEGDAEDNGDLVARAAYHFRPMAEVINLCEFQLFIPVTDPGGIDAN
jgi:hypothetical protein